MFQARISIFGLGYVGAVSAACLAQKGHTIVGVDVNADKVGFLNEGRSPIVEKGLGELIAGMSGDGRLSATTDPAKAVAETDVSLICVGTPSRPNGSLNTAHLEKVAEQIGAAMAAKQGRHTVVVRSTVLPGTVRGVVVPALERASGLVAERDFGLAVNPEFLRESTAIADFWNPPKTVIGASDQATADLMLKIYEGLPNAMIVTSVEVAEMVKYADNVWHAIKVSFANEVGVICKAVGVDSHQVMDIFCRDTHLNLSPYYMKPGFAFGGSCLPKDVRALNYKARSLDLDLPLISNILPSNRQHIERGIEAIMAPGSKRIGFLGLSFKAGTDDLRESPLVSLVEHVIGKGATVKIYDRNVSLARLVGANRDYLLGTIPHISSLLVGDIDEVLSSCDVVVIGNRDPEFEAVSARLKPGQTLVDLVRIADRSGGEGHYDGICW
jgi:GDP-mannose 6-dehydrogenase